MVFYKCMGEIEYKMFKDILNYFDDKDVFVFNDIKVFFVCLYGNKEKIGVCIEVFLLCELNEELCLWDVLVDLVCKICIGNKFYFGDDDLMVVEVIDNIILCGCMFCFLYDGFYDEFKKVLYVLGEILLLYMILNCLVEEEDVECFQFIFVKNEGVVIVLIVSLYFSCELMKCMEIKGIDFVYIILYVGFGNFCDIDVEDLIKYKMDFEQMFVMEEVVKIVNCVKDLGKNVCVVGIIVMCVIESMVSIDGYLKEYEGWMNKFIFFLYDFIVVNVMVLNFYMLFFMLLMIVVVFGGYDQVMDVYYIVLKEGYCFGIYGDVMLILDK